jgi:hypothetical protein
VDTFKLRAGEEMLLRNDEIERLKEKGPLFRTYQISTSQSRRQAQYQDRLKHEHVFNQGTEVMLVAS